MVVCSLPSARTANGTKLARHTHNTHESDIFRKQGKYCNDHCSKPVDQGKFYLAHQHRAS